MPWFIAMWLVCSLGSMAPDRSQELRNTGRWACVACKALASCSSPEASRTAVEPCLCLGQGQGHNQSVEPDWGRRLAPCVLESRSWVSLFSQHCQPPTSFVKETREENTALVFICILFLLQSFKKINKMLQAHEPAQGLLQWAGWTQLMLRLQTPRILHLPPSSSLPPIQPHCTILYL